VCSQDGVALLGVGLPQTQLLGVGLHHLHSSTSRWLSTASATPEGQHS
jgi:hypothetical protein